MKTKYCKLLFILPTFILTFACSNDNDDDKTPDPNPPGGAVDVETNSDGGTSSLNMGIEGKWYAEAEESWIQLSTTAGTGKQDVQINTTINRTQEDRSAKINVYAGSLKRSQTKAGESPVQTFTVSQKGREDVTNIAAHFTEVKIEEGVLKFKLWTGEGGGIYDIDESPVRYYSSGGGLSMVDQTLAREKNKETDWVSFKKISIANINNNGKIKVGDQPTINSIKIMQEHTLSTLNEPELESSAAIHFAINGNLYYGGGFTSARWSTSGITGAAYTEEPDYGFYRYDTKSSDTRKLNDLPFKGGIATIYNNKPYVLAKNGSQYYTLYEYETSADSWNNIQNFYTDEDILAFYTIDDKFYLTGSQKRYAYKLGDDFIFDSSVTHGANLNPTSLTATFGIGQVCDLEGNVWLCPGNLIYKHTDSGYSEFAETSGYMLGAHKGEIFIHAPSDETKLQRIDSSKETHLLDLFFDLDERIVVQDFGSPRKYAVNLDGALYILGGSKFKMYSPSSYAWVSDNKLYKFDVENYSPVSLMLVTDK